VDNGAFRDRGDRAEAIWWLWGCFVSNHEEPLFGEHESMSCLVILPVAGLTVDSPSVTMLVDFLRGAEERHRVDVGIVYDLDRAHPDYLSATVEALETK